MKTHPTIKLLATNLFLLTCLYFFPKTYLHATHITGGELSYECLGSNLYRINLKIYRDCMNGQSGFDDPARISIWTATGTHMLVLEIPFQGATTLPYISADTNWVPQGYVCVEAASYTGTVGLTQAPQGYIFAYQRCCRTGDIINLTDPLNLGSTYWEQVPAVDLCNNSPVFNTDPPLALCVNRPMTFDHSATDIDGDSLVYKLCTPYDGATPTDPQPYVSSAPPFSLVTYNSPYTMATPLDASPALSIDPVTGIVTLTPTIMGSFVVGICCDEYRAGVLIGSHHSDFRYSVANCPYGIGIENYTSISCEVYPNPTRDKVQFKSDEEMNVMIFDIVGKLVYQSTISSETQLISTLGWANGVYSFRAYSKNGIATGKLIKQ